MNIYIEGHDCRVPLMEMVHAMTGEKAVLCEERTAGDCTESRMVRTENGFFVETVISLDGNRYEGKFEKQIAEPNRKQMTNAVKISYYDLACKVYRKTLPWGAMTGIRPAKMAMGCIRQNMNREQTLQHLYENYRVGEEKALLSYETARREADILEKRPLRGVSLYIGIPFCPTKCLYCSFVSQPISKQGRYVEPYLQALKREIKETAELIAENGFTLDTIYMGGGTPTALEAEQLDDLLQTVRRHFDVDKVLEYTVEAGRPDTITLEKLQAIRNGGAARISINPQTMQDRVLRGIGRRHTKEEFIDAFHLAREMGFTHINTDVIAGLPGESLAEFCDSLRELAALEPDAVTVHTMCLKTGAELKRQADLYPTSKQADEMLRFAKTFLAQQNMTPYYMYRQKDTLQNLENTGFAKPNKESLYNILMMEDLTPVFALGAGGVSHMYLPGSGQVVRAFNMKYAPEYISEIDLMIQRKRDMVQLVKEAQREEKHENQ